MKQLLSLISLTLFLTCCNSCCQLVHRKDVTKKQISNLNFVEKKDSTMLTYEQCLQMARMKLNEIAVNHPNYIIWEEKTIPKYYGWIFILTTNEYLKTGNRKSLVPGMSPIIVNKIDSTSFMVPSYRPLQFFVDEYERQLESKN
jgi:hypothetical protein